MKKIQTRILAFSSLLAVLVVAAAFFVATFNSASARRVSLGGSTPTPVPSSSGVTLKYAPMNYLPSSNVSAADVDNALVPEGIQLGTNNGNHNYVTVAHFKNTFTFAGTIYKYTMVGTDPTAGNATTTIPVNIIPVQISITINGNTFTSTGSDAVTGTLQSPLFKTAQFSSGDTQYGDAIQRAAFWNSVSTISPKYHVLLSKPQILSPLSLTVPAGLGTFGTFPGASKPVGLIDEQWYNSHLQSDLNARHVSTKALTIFLVHNVFKSSDIANLTCCIGGFHSAVKINHHLYTYAESTYNDATTLPSGATFGLDVTALSHEVSEWYNDPFVDNFVPRFAAPGYPCQNVLEVGDPLVGTNLPPASYNGYHLQDEVFFSWFAHQSPSIGINGQYDYLGGLPQSVLPVPAPTC